MDCGFDGRELDEDCKVPCRVPALVTSNSSLKIAHAHLLSHVGDTRQTLARCHLAPQRPPLAWSMHPPGSSAQAIGELILEKRQREAVWGEREACQQSSLKVEERARVCVCVCVSVVNSPHEPSYSCALECEFSLAACWASPTDRGCMNMIHHRLTRALL